MLHLSFRPGRGAIQNGMRGRPGFIRGGTNSRKPGSSVARGAKRSSNDGKQGGVECKKGRDL